MDIKEAERRIAIAKTGNLGTLNLSSSGDKTKLTSDDLKNLLSKIKELKGLTLLNLMDNEISDISFLKELKGLKSLFLSNNQIKDISFLKELKRLACLFLSNNQIKDISFLKELRELRELRLYANQISDISVLKELRELTELSLHSNLILDLPENLISLIERKLTLNKDHIAQIVRYLEEIEEGESYLYEAKVLVVGEPQAGKTTLTQKIVNNDKWIAEIKGTKPESTVGVNIAEVSFPYIKNEQQNIETHFWDFGGHTAQYVLHQYFFTEEAVYVLLADGRKEFPNFPYWFEIIATLGKNCPVLVVLNENDCKPIQTFNISEYRNQFGNNLESIEEKSVNFYNDSDGRFNALKTEIANKVSNLKHIGRPLPAKWVAVCQELEELSKTNAYIGKDKYKEICNKHNLTDADKQNDVLHYLHVLGIALSYDSDQNLRNKLILSPNWVIDALYVVLKDTKIEQAKGIFEVKYVDSLWTELNYSSEDCDILLNLMQKDNFEIAYRLGNTNKYVVPTLLPHKPIEYNLAEINPIELQVQYTFMPKGIISRLIVRLHKSIVVETEQIVWNKGVVISHHNSKAEIIENEHSRQITIKVVGENKHHNRELVTIIRNEIKHIHLDWFNNRLIFEELVSCICKKCKNLKKEYDSMKDEQKTRLSDDERKRYKLEPYKLFNLQERLDKGKTTVECEKSYENINILELLQEVYVIAENKDEFRQGVHISEIKGDNISVNVITDIKGSIIKTSTKQQFNSAEIEQKLDAMFAKLDEKQSQKMVDLLNQIISKIDESKLNKDEAKILNNIKVNSDLKFKIKQGLPMEWFIKQATGTSFEIEKEFKISKEIKPETILGILRKALGHQELQETKFNEIESETIETKLLPK